MPKRKAAARQHTQQPSNAAASVCSWPADRPRYFFCNPYPIHVAARRSGLSQERVDEAMGRARKELRGSRGPASAATLARFFLDKCGFTELEAARLARVVFAMANEVASLEQPGNGGDAA